MSKYEIHTFLRSYFLEKPKGKWNVIYSIWGKSIVVWWNTLLIWAAAANNNLFWLGIIYFLIAVFALVLYMKAR